MFVEATENAIRLLVQYLAYPTKSVPLRPAHKTVANTGKPYVFRVPNTKVCHCHCFFQKNQHQS